MHLSATEPFSNWAGRGESALNGSYPDNKNPFDERQAEARDGAIAAGS